MSKSKYNEITSDDLWTKNGKQLYEAGMYDSMVEARIEAVKAKPKNSKMYEQLKEQMVEYLYYVFCEKEKSPLDKCAKLAGYAKQAKELYTDVVMTRWWKTYFESIKYIVDFSAKNQATKSHA